jgi:hypothetical protein
LISSQHLDLPDFDPKELTELLRNLAVMEKKWLI